MISFSVKGDWSKTDKYLKKLEKQEYMRKLNKYGQQGVAALSAATPRDSGATAASWSYQLWVSKEHTELVFYNHNNEGGANVAVLIQYGHGTGTGGYVAGKDFINPALRPIFDRMAEEIWAEVRKL